VLAEQAVPPAGGASVVAGGQALPAAGNGFGADNATSPGILIAALASAGLAAMVLARRRVG
jgi:hypothetical protein